MIRRVRILMDAGADMPSCLSYLSVRSSLILLLITGCSGEGANGPAPVAGKISYRGQPVTRGTIVFAPDPLRGGEGDPVRTSIQPDGRYQMPGADKQGVAPGWYRVTVAAVDMGPIDPGSPILVPRSLLPEKYRDPELSGLSCEVKAGRDNTINFNLE